MATTNDLKNGMTLDIEGQLWTVVEFQHVKPGKGPAFVRTKLKQVLTGKVVDKTYNAGVKVEIAILEKREMNFLYKEGDDFVFMDNVNFDQMNISADTVGDAINGELGFLDGYYKGSILAAIEKIGGKNYLTSVKLPPSAPTDIIKSILSRVKQHEGIKSTKYIDSRGIPTVGVGFNLKRADADQKLKSVGANPAKVKQGKQALNNNQIETLLVGDLKSSKEAANRLVGSLTQHPSGVQGVLIEMTFNLGANGLAEFKNFLTAVKAKNYTSAAKETLKSSWSKQVGDRAKTLATIVSNS